MEKNNIFLYAGLFILIALLSVSVLVKNRDINGKITSKNPELEKYRSSDIPEDCRMPEYENDAGRWKEHLSHHQQTSHCLKYYGGIR